MSERYLRELKAELGAVGIRGARRRRILAETADHLHESPDPARFGAPKLIAARFADELATSGARRAAFSSFVVLAPAGVLYVVLFGLIRTWPDIASARFLPLAICVAFAMVLAPQVAFAAGLLAVARAWRLRPERASPAGEIIVLRRRSAVALGSGAAAFAAIAVYASEYSASLPGWWQDMAYGSAGAALVALGVAGVALARTARLQPQTAGRGGGLFDDLEPVLDVIPLRLRGHPWLLCLLVAGAAAAAALLAGGPGEGPRNAAFEFVTVCAGFFALGGFLGLKD